MSALSILCSVADHTKNHRVHPLEEIEKVEPGLARMDLSAGELSAFYESLKMFENLPQGAPDLHAGSKCLPGKRLNERHQDGDGEQQPGSKRQKSAPRGNLPIFSATKPCPTSLSQSRSANPIKHEYRHSKAHKALGIPQDYSCGYCGVQKTSASACSDGRVITIDSGMLFTTSCLLPRCGSELGSSVNLLCITGTNQV